MRCWLFAFFLFLLSSNIPAETVAGLPAPQGYVNDFADVLSDSVKQRVESLCASVDRQAHAQIAVVTIKTIDGDQSIEEFATQLEDKWKVGAKGTDRSVLMLLVMTPRKGRIEVGYGLEGVLNDAKVGDIGRSMTADAKANDYDAAVPLGVQQLADVIAADAGVTLTSANSNRQVSHQPASVGIGQIALLVILGIFILSVLGRGGRGGGGSGLGWFVLGNILGGIGGSGRGGFNGGSNDDSGFGGFGGGSSGGGGASGDF